MRLSLSLVTTGLVLPAAAVLVADNSPCSTDCGNVLDQTTTDDVVCSQSSYSNAAGLVFNGCVSCEASSKYSSGGETDTQWMLYNLRYAVSFCLFGVPDNSKVISTPCITSKACGPFQSAIEYKNLSTNIDSYDYCSLWPVNDESDFQGCTSCLQAGGEQYLANFFTVLQAGCEQQPATGVTVSIEGSIFSSDIVNITSPTPTASVNPDWFDTGPLTLGAKVGIAFGGLAFILIILGFGIVWNGKRRRRAFLRNLETHHGHKGWPTPNAQQSGAGEMRETPLSQRPLRGWDDSPMSASTEKNFGRYFSPYSSQYSSPVHGNEGPSMQWPGAQATPTPPVGLAITADFGDRWGVNQPEPHMRQPSGETYELREVESAGGSFKARMEAQQAMAYHLQHEAPVLGHPGYGRNEHSPPRTYNVADPDSKSGHSF